jgi:molybdate transport system permease protein
LRRAGVWSRLDSESRLVYGANVRQALQFAETGNTDVGMTALSLVVGRGGSYLLVDEDHHSPLGQAVVICSRTEHESEARELISFLGSQPAQDILAKHGFLQAGTSPPPREADDAGFRWAPLALSFRVAATATLLALLFGVAIATLLASYRFRGRELLDALLTAPLVLPPTVLGYYLLVTLGRRSAVGEIYEDLTGSPIVFTVTGAVVAATVGALPLVIKSARAALEGVDPTLSQAARTLGAGRLRLFFTIRLPLAAPGIIAGAMLGFAKALGDFGATLMVAGNIPGETQTAALYIYDAIEANRGNQASGMVAVLSAIAVLAIYAVNKLTRRSTHV